MSHPLSLDPPSAALLIPLIGRARETQRREHLIDDPKAVEIVDALEVDVSQWDRGTLAGGASLRTALFDRLVQTFLDAHPDGTVVEVGVGLNTRFERLDNGRARWFEVDLPDTMALRRRFFEDAERRTMIVGDARALDWHDVVAEAGGPFCFVSEAVLTCLETEQVERALRGIGSRFPGSHLITDTLATANVEAQARDPIMSKLPPTSWFRWKCDDPRAIEAWGLRLEQTVTVLDAQADLVDRMPWMFRTAVRWIPGLLRGRVQDYRLNRYRFA
ncbi:MAG: class I SAM-dependent methyltransferase [Myxococcota bacterium]